MDQEDVRVLQPRGGANLAQESLWADRMSQLRMQHLDRDGTVVPQVAREVDRRHTAAGRSPQVILARHAADPVPPVRTVCPEVPVAVEHALVRALAKNPADRWPSAAAFRDALRA
jgi:hypothetical protein